MMKLKKLKMIKLKQVFNREHQESQHNNPHKVIKKKNFLLNLQIFFLNFTYLNPLFKKKNYKL